VDRLAEWIVGEVAIEALDPGFGRIAAMQWIDARSPGPKYAECGTTWTPNASARVMTRRISVHAADLGHARLGIRDRPRFEGATNSQSLP